MSKRTAPVFNGLTIVDDDGRPRALLKCIGDGVRLSLFDSKARERAVIGLDNDDKHRLSFLTPEGETALHIGQSWDGSYGIYLNHQNGTTAMRIVVAESGEPMIELCNTRGERIWGVGGIG